jgi:lipopolysaccharide/colanic/teichoic acid biosynthesis glycosyltransferase
VRRPESLYVRYLKPAIDRSVASVALVVAAVPMTVISAVIIATAGRPVLFRQQRVGLDGSMFDVLKFRTMRPDRRRFHQNVGSDRRVTHKTTADPRHTPTGMFLRRFSLDELPQLINVVRGEMSIVGPRPELVGVVDTYGAELRHLHQRHYVKPGLTGLWQVSARSDGPMRENGHWDLDYVEQVSLRTDLSIVARTPGAMFGDNRGS